MDRRFVLAGAGAAAFLLTLVARVPASIALAWFAPEGMQATGVSGTLWSGFATGLVAGPVRLSESDWTLSPLALLAGRATGTLSTRIGEASFDGNVSWRGAGSFSCEACVFEGPLSALQPVVPALKSLTGKAHVDIRTLDVRDKWPTRVVATVDLAGVPLTAPGQAPGPTSPRASFSATFGADPVPEGGRIEGAVSDSGGPVEIKARLTLTPPGSYALAGRAKARPDAGTDLVNALNVLGPKAADGSTELAMSGTF
jgi:general secretion pathway protein N